MMHTSIESIENLSGCNHWQYILNGMKQIGWRSPYLSTVKSSQVDGWKILIADGRHRLRYENTRDSYVPSFHWQSTW